MTATWAHDELLTADLGDERLDARFVLLLSALGNHPSLPIPAACRTHAELKAAYRFFDNDLVSFESVLAPHIDQTRVRIAQHPVVLLVQDTSEVDLTRPAQPVEGVGPLTGKRRGLFLHLMHAFTPDGIPLGSVWAQLINRDDSSESEVPLTAEEKRRQRKAAPIEDKESQRWLDGLRAARELAQKYPDTQFICVADSESDIYEVLSEPRGERPVHYLVRACQDRALSPEPSTQDSQQQTTPGLRASVGAAEKLYEVDMIVRARPAKIEADTRKRRQARTARQAKLEVRAKTVTLRPGKRKGGKLPRVEVNCVLISEVNPPAGEPAIEWLLLTTLPITTPDEVKVVVSHYCHRWGIEVLFKTLKSGCRVERRRFEQRERISACLGLYLIVAWRVLYVSRLGQKCPELDCESVFEPAEWKAVWSAVKKQKPPEERPSVGEIVKLIAGLGGYIDRRDSQPGPQVMWIGMQRMYDLAWAWDSFGPGSQEPG